MKEPIDTFTLLSGLFMGMIVGMALFALGCGTNPPIPPVPTPAPASATIEATPTPTPTAGFDVAACLAKAQSDCDNACLKTNPCEQSCLAVRDNTCQKLGG